MPKTFKDLHAEENAVAANNVQGGRVAGLGGVNGEPGINKTKKNKKRTFRDIHSTAKV